MTSATASTPEQHAPLVADPVALLKELVRINSVNPELVPGAPGESALADYVSAWLQNHGFVVTRLEEVPGRPSIVGVARGTGGGNSLMFNGHLDTVTLAGYDGDPLEPRIEDGKMFGRGTFDMKAGIAAILTAAASAAAQPHRGDILVALVADEEYGSAGTEEVLRHFTADAAIVSEPTHEDVVVAHRGFTWFDVTIHGVAAHGSRPDLGLDAIAKAGRFLAALDNHATFLATGATQHPTLGAGNIHASLIRGGEELSSYPAECIISLERRTIPGENAETVEADLRRMLDGIAATDPDFTYTITRRLERGAFEVSEQETIVQSLLTAAAKVTGKDLTLRGEPFWTDAALMLDAGIPGLLFGVDGGGAHASTEWIELESLARVTAILTATTTSYCNEEGTR